MHSFYQLNTLYCILICPKTKIFDKHAKNFGELNLNERLLVEI